MAENVPQVINWDSELKGAAALLKSGLAPRDLKSAEACLFVILAGRDLGLSPVQSLRSIRVIQGKLEASADLQLGLFHREGGKFRWVKLDASGAELELQAPWLASPHVSKFGPEEAKRAELMSNANYRKFPQAMFRSRAITQGLKDIGFLAGSGVYAPGEIGGAAVVDMETGEVLPGETVEQAPLPKREISSTAGVVEALSDERRSELEEIALFITDHLEDGKAVQAWRDCSNDEKVAVWAMLDKETRKAIKALTQPQKQQVETIVVAPVPTQEELIKEARVCISKGKLDLARELLRDVQEPAKTELLAELEAA